MHGENPAQTGVTAIQIAATIIFAIALLHSFMVGKFNEMAHHHRRGSVKENLYHLLGEVEAVFPMWAAVLIGVMALIVNWDEALHYLETRNFTEPAFVFAIMLVASTRPVVDTADALIRFVARLLPFNSTMSFFISSMVIGPLTGSFITEPAAMTLTTLLLMRQFMAHKHVSQTFKYGVLAVTLVNVSIGGSLTNFAAPPVLMVASTWSWDVAFMMQHFGYKAAIAVILNTLGVAYVFRETLKRIKLHEDSDIHGEHEAMLKSPLWVKALHLVALTAIVINSHHAVVFLGVLFVFLGFFNVSMEYQEPLKVRGSLLVAGFLGGLIILGGMQSWWIEPLLRSLSDMALYVGATGLTAITDNALLTYLVSQVQGLSDTAKFFAVAGALAGGGLTLIANAPNPIAKSVFGHVFGERGIEPLKLLIAAALPTIVAFLAFLILP
jgi:hypothetical protein